MNMEKNEQSCSWDDECARMLRERMTLSPDRISDDYALLRTVVLIKNNDLMHSLPERTKAQLQELDGDWYDLLSNAEKVFYRMGFMDAVMCHDSNRN